jgi:hypothetical protein
MHGKSMQGEDLYSMMALLWNLLLPDLSYLSSWKCFIPHERQDWAAHATAWCQGALQKLPTDTAEPQTPRIAQGLHS